MKNDYLLILKHTPHAFIKHICFGDHHFNIKECVRQRNILVEIKITHNNANTIDGKNYCSNLLNLMTWFS